MGASWRILIGSPDVRVSTRINFFCLNAQTLHRHTARIHMWPALHSLVSFHSADSPPVSTYDIYLFLLFLSFFFLMNKVHQLGSAATRIHCYSVKEMRNANILSHVPSHKPRLTCEARACGRYVPLMGFICILRRLRDAQLSIKKANDILSKLTRRDRRT